VRKALRESGETARLDPGLNIAIPHALEIDHGRCDIAVAHPLLQGSDIDAVLQMAGGVGVAELVRKPSPAVRPLPAAVDADRPVFQLVSRGAMAAVEFPPVCNSLQLLQHGAVGPAAYSAASLNVILVAHRRGFRNPRRRRG